MRPRTWSWTAAALLAAGLASLPAPAVAGSFASSPAGDRVHAGDVVPLHWTLQGTETGGRDEMELVLSVDDGATFPVRVVTRLEAGAGALRWRVPALPTEHARLALRAGEDGDADTEQIVAVSDAFAIATSPFETVERLYAVAGEWRTRDALEGAPARTDDGGLAPEEGTREIASRDREKSEPETSPSADVTPVVFNGGRAISSLISERAPVAPPSPTSAPLPLRL